MKDALEHCTKALHDAWGPLTTERVANIRHHLETLLGAPETERWLQALVEEAPESRELYRDPVHGFVLLAHVEPQGLYRPPHDHGTGWVFYGVARGETEMSTYGRVLDERGEVRLVQRDSTRLRPGEARIYLPGDIHDTRCAEGPLLLYRLTSCDLKRERVTRYAQRNGVWTTPTALANLEAP